MFPDLPKSSPLLAAGAPLDLPPWSVAPFVLLLLTIALLPLAVPHWWHNNRNKAIIAAVFGIPVVLYLAGLQFIMGQPTLPLLSHELVNYFSFITLLGSLYVVSGGIIVEGDFRADTAHEYALPSRWRDARQPHRHDRRERATHPPRAAHQQAATTVTTHSSVLHFHRQQPRGHVDAARRSTIAARLSQWCAVHLDAATVAGLARLEWFGTGDLFCLGHVRLWARTTWGPYFAEAVRHPRTAQPAISRRYPGRRTVARAISNALG